MQAITQNGTKIHFVSAVRYGKSIQLIINKSQYDIEKSLEEHMHIKDYSRSYIQENFKCEYENFNNGNTFSTTRYYDNNTLIITRIMKAENNEIKYKIIENWKEDLLK